MRPEALILSAFFLDLLIGDPKWMWHPVQAIGMVARFLERGFRDALRSRVLAGGWTTLLVVGGTYSFVVCLERMAQSINPVLGDMVSVSLLFMALATRSLYEASRKVASLLKDRGLFAARRSLAKIVGRDTGNLDRNGIIRATVETVAENTVDGIIAPLFYACLGGAPLAWAYKAINTLDSMFGYKNERYFHFGRVPAKLDDFANWFPARLTGWAMIGAAFVCRLDGKRACKIMMRDGRSHASPNAGISEAAVAGALGIQLGGPSAYQGVEVAKPFIGDGERNISISDIPRCQRIMFVTSMISLGGMLLVINRFS